MYCFEILSLICENSYKEITYRNYNHAPLAAICHLQARLAVDNLYTKFELPVFNHFKEGRGLKI